MFVREWRQKRGISRNQLAWVAGISRQALVNIESGKVKKGKRKTRMSLARILGCRSADLFKPPPDDLEPIQRLRP